MTNFPVCDKHRLADWQVNEENLVVECFNPLSPNINIQILQTDL